MSINRTCPTPTEFHTGHLLPWWRLALRLPRLFRATRSCRAALGEGGAR